MERPNDGRYAGQPRARSACRCPFSLKCMQVHRVPAEEPRHAPRLGRRPGQQPQRLRRRPSRPPGDRAAPARCSVLPGPPPPGASRKTTSTAPPSPALSASGKPCRQNSFLPQRRRCPPPCIRARRYVSAPPQRCLEWSTDAPAGIPAGPRKSGVPRSIGFHYRERSPALWSDCLQDIPDDRQRRHQLPTRRGRPC